MLRLFMLFSFLGLVILSSCKKEEPIGGDKSDAAKLATVVNVQNELGEYLRDILPFQGDTLQILRELGTWIDSKEGVDASYFIDEAMIQIDFDNGLSSFVRFIPVGADGLHETRGGGNKGQLSHYNFANKAATNTIKNEKVLILNPVLEDFYGSTYGKESQFLGGPVSFDVKVFNNEQVTLDLLNTLGEYGFIILNTHGKKNGFLIKDMPDFNVATQNWTKEQVSELLVNQSNLPKEKFISGELELNLHVYYSPSSGVTTYSSSVYVTEKYIRNLNVDLSDAVLFGNTCYSGHTADGPNENNMPEAWRSRGLATYYGYSYVNDIGVKVENKFCIRMEDSLIKNLAINTDSTGIAHLEGNSFLQYYNTTVLVKPRSKKKVMMSFISVDDVDLPINQPLFFKQFFAEDYSYSTCQDTLLDIRDGTVYKTVCIGDQVWMAENLNWAGAGDCYNNDPINCKIFGRLYSIMEATGAQSSNGGNTIRGICPKGWHIPSQAEIVELLDTLGGFSIAGDKLKADTLWNTSQTDPYGFRLLPAGFWDRGTFQSLGSRARIWGSSTNSGGNAFFAMDVPDLFPNVFQTHYVINNHPSWKFSCRCVKD